MTQNTRWRGGGYRQGTPGMLSYSHTIGPGQSEKQVPHAFLYREGGLTKDNPPISVCQPINF